MTHKEQKHPSLYSPDLKQEYLEVLCYEVLNTVNEALIDASTEYDTAWTQGTLPYGRIQGLCKALHKDKSKPWFTLANATMDYTAKILNTPIQFVIDNPSNPRKSHRLRANDIELQQYSLELSEQNEHEFLTWRLFIDDNKNDEVPSLSATLVGFNSDSIPVCVWQYEKIDVVPVRMTEFATEIEIDDAQLRRKDSQDEIHSDDKINEAGNQN